MAIGRADPEVTREYADFIKQCVTTDEAAALYEASVLLDATSDLPRVRVPTLVLARASHSDFVASARELASAIDEARLVLLEGEASPPHIGDIEPVLAAINNFLGTPAPDAAAAPITAVTAGALVTILVTDVEGSTALTDRLGDAAAREVLREHERITREALKAHGGSEVKTMGDGFMASFGSATKALECAVAIQRALEPESTVEARHASPLRPEGTIRVRIGLNAGEPIAEDDPDGRSDLFGTAVIVAARIAGQAQGGEILVSDVVRQLVAGKRFLFNDRGEHALKGFEDPVRVFEVSWREVA